LLLTWHRFFVSAFSNFLLYSIAERIEEITTRPTAVLGRDPARAPHSRIERLRFAACGLSFPRLRSSVVSQNNPILRGLFARLRGQNQAAPCDPFSAFVRAKADRFRYSAAIAPSWDNGTTALAATFGVFLNTDLGHDSQVCLALTIGALGHGARSNETIALWKLIKGMK
jgi:hypothetical protein